MQVVICAIKEANRRSIESNWTRHYRVNVLFIHLIKNNKIQSHVAQSLCFLISQRINEFNLTARIALDYCIHANRITLLAVTMNDSVPSASLTMIGTLHGNTKMNRNLRFQMGFAKCTDFIHTGFCLFIFICVKSISANKSIAHTHSVEFLICKKCE